MTGQFCLSWFDEAVLLSLAARLNSTVRRLHVIVRSCQDSHESLVTDMSHANNHRAEHQRLKYTHAQLFAEVSRILVRHDPIGLIALGAPDDEYEPEVSTILPRLREADSVDDLQRIIHQEFVSWFSDEEVAESEVHYAAIAEDVWAVWQRYVQKPGEHAEWA